MNQRAEMSVWQHIKKEQGGPGPLKEKTTKPEQQLFGRLGGAVGEVVRDVKEASDRAKKKFDGDSAFLHAARGAMTAGVGVGLEVGTNAFFDKAWRGEGPIWERFVLGAETGQQLARFAEQHPRLAHFIKEGTQDISLAALYNFIAFRSQPIFTQVEAQDVLRSLAVDAFEAGFVGSIPEEMRTAAGRISQGSDTQRNRGRRGFNQEAPYTAPIKDMRRSLIGQAFDVSNPATQLGLMMVYEGVRELAKNYKDIQSAKKTAKWSGGKVTLSGKGESNVYFGSSRSRYNGKRREYDQRYEDT